MRSVIRWTLPLFTAALMVLGSFTLARADDTPAASGGKGTISGTVTKDGQPDANVEVRLMNRHAGGGAAAAAGGATTKPAPLMTAQTDDKGAFTLSDVPEGSYNLTVGTKKDGRGTAKVDVKAGQTATVAITVQPAVKPQ